MSTGPSVFAQVAGLLLVALFLTAACALRTVRLRWATARLIASAEAPLPGRTCDVVHLDLDDPAPPERRPLLELVPTVPGQRAS